MTCNPTCLSISLPQSCGTKDPFNKINVWSSTIDGTKMVCLNNYQDPTSNYMVCTPFNTEISGKNKEGVVVNETFKESIDKVCTIDWKALDTQQDTRLLCKKLSDDPDVVGKNQPVYACQFDFNNKKCNNITQ